VIKKYEITSSLSLDTCLDAGIGVKVLAREVSNEGEVTSAIRRDLVRGKGDPWMLSGRRAKDGVVGINEYRRPRWSSFRHPELLFLVEVADGWE
jgi:hypothetical protein